MNNKYILLAALMLLGSSLWSQAKYRYLDTCFEAVYEQLVITDFNDNLNIDQEDILVTRFIKISATINYHTSDSRACVEYYIRNHGFSMASLAGEGELIGRFTLCEAADSTVHVLNPSTYDLLSLIEFEQYVDSIMQVHPRARLNWDSLQLTPGFIETDTVVDNQSIDFMRVNAEAWPPRLDNPRPDSIMIFRDLKPYLLYDFGMDVGDSIKLVLFESHYYWQDLDESNDTVQGVLRSVGEHRRIGQWYEFSSVDKFPGVRYNPTSRVGIEYPLPYGDFAVFRDIDFVFYSPTCAAYCDTTIGFRQNCPISYPPFVDPCASICHRKDTITSTAIVVDTSSVELPQLSLYPNPATDHMRVSWSGIDDGGQLMLFDLSGRPIAVHHVGGQTNESTIDVTGLPPGIYHLTLIAGKSSLSARVIIMD